MSHRRRMIRTAIQAPASADAFVREVAISVLEHFGGREAGIALDIQASRDPDPALAEFCKRVAAELWIENARGVRR